MDLLNGLEIHEDKYSLVEGKVENFLKDFLLKYPSYYMDPTPLNDELVNQFKTRFPELIKQ